MKNSFNLTYELKTFGLATLWFILLGIAIVIIADSTMPAEYDHNSPEARLESDRLDYLSELEACGEQR